MKPSADILKSYVGNYRMPDGMKLNFEQNGDTLFLIIPGAPKFVMHAESETEFFLKEFDAQCTFNKPVNGKCPEITWHQNNHHPKGYRAGNPPVLSINDLQNYSGNYVSEPLNVSYPVIVKNNKLILVVPKNFKTYLGIDQEVLLDCVDKDQFFTQRLGMLEFIRDSHKNITGFKFIDLGRVKNLEFKRKG